MKTRIFAVIEICKMYKEGCSIDTVLWQKPCSSTKEAQEFIKRVGEGRKGLYSVNSSDIEIE